MRCSVRNLIGISDVQIEIFRALLCLSRQYLGVAGIASSEIRPSSSVIPSSDATVSVLDALLNGAHSLQRLGLVLRAWEVLYSNSRLKIERLSILQDLISPFRKMLEQQFQKVQGYFFSNTFQPMRYVGLTHATNKQSLNKMTKSGRLILR